MNRNLDSKESLKKFDGEKLITKQALSWKKQFDNGVIIPSRKKDLICVDCDKLLNQTKIYASNLNELEKKPPENFGHMLPYYKEE